jgi:DNA-binding PadR family transcriptional regulator
MGSVSEYTKVTTALAMNCFAYAGDILDSEKQVMQFLSVQRAYRWQSGGGMMHQATWGAMLGLSRQQLNRALRRLEARQLIEVDRDASRGRGWGRTTYRLSPLTFNFCVEWFDSVRSELAKHMMRAERDGWTPQHWLDVYERYDERTIRMLPW